MKKTERHQSIAYQNSERGQSLVELALTFTILAILLGGVLELGRAFFTFVALRDAAQEGAVYGSIHATDLADRFDLTWIVRDNFKTG